MDYTVLGKTVNLAARLEASAPRQGILIASDTQLLVHRDIVTEQAEPIMVKGFEKPVPIYRVLGVKR
jgi:class 3 adenylate cyclase